MRGAGVTPGAARIVDSRSSAQQPDRWTRRFARSASGRREQRAVGDDACGTRRARRTGRRRAARTRQHARARSVRPSQRLVEKLRARRHDERLGARRRSTRRRARRSTSPQSGSTAVEAGCARTSARPSAGARRTGCRRRSTCVTPPAASLVERAREGVVVGVPGAAADRPGGGRAGRPAPRSPRAAGRASGCARRPRRTSSPSRRRRSRAWTRWSAAQLSLPPLHEIAARGFAGDIR